MLNTDAHIHTSLCRHAVGTMDEYVRRAVELGLERICFTDHVPLPFGFDPTHRMVPEELPGYIDQVKKLQHHYRDTIEICLGLECDFLPGVESWLERLLHDNHYDYVLGSVHFVGRLASGKTIFVMRPGNAAPEQLETTYWRQLEEMVKTGLFDAAAHLDIFKQADWQPCPEQLPQMERVLDCILEFDMALEFNSSGWDKPGVKEAYPDKLLLQMAVKRAIPIICGSDAHSPGQVGRHRERMTARLRQLGVTQHAFYRQRQRVMLPL
ncbi:histidinol-phosphatase HisJ [bacterium]|nr:histidinol-phosphatase HisJ [bacterium]